MTLYGLFVPARRPALRGMVGRTGVPIPLGPCSHPNTGISTGTIPDAACVQPQAALVVSRPMVRIDGVHQCAGLTKYGPSAARADAFHDLPVVLAVLLIYLLGGRRVIGREVVARLRHGFPLESALRRDQDLPSGRSELRLLCPRRNGSNRNPTPMSKGPMSKGRRWMPISPTCTRHFRSARLFPLPSRIGSKRSKA